MKALLNSASCLTPRAIADKFRKDEDGIAAIEFAIIAPIMIMMYFGLAEIASAISTDRRISHGTNVAGDLATQQPEMLASDLEEIVSAALRVMEVPDAGKVSIDIESFILDSNGDPESRGRVQLNPGVGNLGTFDASTLDDKILSDNSGVVVTRVSYTYTPMKLRYFDTDINLTETFLLKPRRSDAVELSADTGGQLTCSATSYANVSCTQPAN